MLNWNTISDHKHYNQQRFDLLKLVEGSVATPYVDGVGAPTIGIGFNLEVDANLEAVLRILVGKKNWSDTLFNRLKAEVGESYDPYRSGPLIDNLNGVMKDWHDHHDKDVPVSFAFRSDAQIARALDAIAPGYDAIMDNWLAGIPESSERAALFSLTWNAPGLLGPKLHAAIDSGDRAEAWYEIRYNSLSSSLPANLKAAIANRRYVEADTFNLYHNDARATYAEAVDAGRMLAAHHGDLLGYEATYDPLKAASVKGVETIGSINTELQPAISTVLTKYHLHLGSPIEELLATDVGRRDLTGDGTGYDTTNNDADLLLGDKAGNRLSGNSGNDVLIGLKGVDTLTGGAGSDVFVFTAAKDSTAAGKGDTISDFSAGDRIAFTSPGIDFHLLEARGDAFSDDIGEIRWRWNSGKTVVEVDYDGDGHADLHLTLSGKHVLSAGDFVL